MEEEKLSHKNVVSFIFQTIVSTLIAIVLIIYSPFIIQLWDETNGIKPDIYLSLSRLIIIDDKEFLNISDINSERAFSNTLMSIQESLNLTPLPFNSTKPLTLVDRETKETDCMYTFFKEPSKETKIIGYRTPDRELNNPCENCLYIILYGKNFGNKTVDNLDIKIYFDETYIKEAVEGEKLERCGNSCILIKESNIGNDETVLASVALKRFDDRNIFDDKIIKRISATYTVWNQKLIVPQTQFTDTLLIVKKNCTSI